MPESYDLSVGTVICSLPKKFLNTALISLQEQRNAYERINHAGMDRKKGPVNLIRRSKTSHPSIGPLGLILASGLSRRTGNG